MSGYSVVSIPSSLLTSSGGAFGTNSPSSLEGEVGEGGEREEDTPGESTSDSGVP